MCLTDRESDNESCDTATGSNLLPNLQSGKDDIEPELASADGSIL